ncbi:DUF2964 family protein [bacterium]|nr:DUF2964 family protein [bacterium]
MFLRILLAALAVFILWAGLDFVIHGLLLGAMYEQTKELWRPMAEVKFASGYLASFISAFFFVAVYGWLIKPKNMKNAVIYGLLFGLGVGTAMGYGTYAYMPIPYWMAFGWFLGSTVQGLLAGVLLGIIVKKPEDAAAATT